ncbi:MAG: DUF1989 domain-containing protein [Pseudomonadota bacterium]
MTTLLDQIVPAKAPWSGVVPPGGVLTITDLEGSQAVDFLCYAAEDPGDRYSATNTIKVQENIYIGLGTVLYADSGTALMRVVEDTLGGHDTLYGCCSNPNNRLRYGVETTESCYTNFEAELARRGMGRDAIVPNINWFMRVTILPGGRIEIADPPAAPGARVGLRAECAVLAVLSNCPQMHNPCNGYNPTPIRVQITAP